MERFTQVVDAITRRVAQLAFGLMLLVVLVGTFNTLARSADRSLGTALSSNAYLELQWYLFACIFLLGGAYTLRRDAHVRVDVLYDRLGKRARAWIDLVGHAVFLLPFCAFMVWASFDPVLDSWRRGEVSPDPSGLPRYPIKTLIPLAFVLLGVQGLSELLKRIAILREPPPDAAEPAEPEPEPSPPEPSAPEPDEEAAPKTPSARVVVVVREPPGPAEQAASASQHPLPQHPASAGDGCGRVEAPQTGTPSSQRSGGDSGGAKPPQKPHGAA